MPFAESNGEPRGVTFPNLPNGKKKLGDGGRRAGPIALAETASISLVGRRGASLLVCRIKKNFSSDHPLLVFYSSIPLFIFNSRIPPWSWRKAPTKAVVPSQNLNLPPATIPLQAMLVTTTTTLFSCLLVDPRTALPWRLRESPRRNRPLPTLLPHQLSQERTTTMTLYSCTTLLVHDRSSVTRHHCPLVVSPLLPTTSCGDVEKPVLRLAMLQRNGNLPSQSHRY